MAQSASLELSSLVQLKAADSYPMGLVVYGVEFSGNQSLAARQALALILSHANFTMPRSSVDSGNSSAQGAKQQDLYQSAVSMSPANLDESAFPYRLASGELVSFSHSKTRVVIGLASPKYRTLGVDTELKPVSAQLAERFFTANELRIIESTQDQPNPAIQDLLRQTAWMIKEAHGKAAGLTLFEAIAFDLSAVLLHAISNPKDFKDSDLSDWVTRHRGFEFTGNLHHHWVLCARLG